MSEIRVISYRRDVEKAVEKAMLKAVRMIGGSISGHAVEGCPVDTGLLKNSITFAIGGQAPAITNYQSDTKDKNGEYKTGQYDGQAPDDDDNEYTVYVGTNVQYATYQELGTPNRGMDARPFLRPAFEDHKDEIRQIIEKCCKEIR